MGLARAVQATVDLSGGRAVGVEATPVNALGFVAAALDPKQFGQSGASVAGPAECRRA